ncbi:transmembrane protein 87A-like [Clytia hemisphaerica]|uniref:GOST seven transmembrane domain-containing protein n=1 Tax=Clytia hemisphaerica TaxID=252671 RepID=A0A7M5XLD9_9CNID
MYEDSLITYTMHCSPAGEKKHFSVKINLYHHFCHLPRDKTPLLEKDYNNIPCHDHALSSLDKKIRRDIEHAIRKRRAEDTAKPQPPATVEEGKNILKKTLALAAKKLQDKLLTQKPGSNVKAVKAAGNPAGTPEDKPKKNSQKKPALKTTSKPLPTVKMAKALPTVKMVKTNKPVKNEPAATAVPVPVVKTASPESKETTKDSYKKDPLAHQVGRNELRTNMTGLFIVALTFESTDEVTIKGRIDSVHKGSYLSAMIYPLLPFYGVMSLIYLAYAIGWFIATCCNWKDLLRVQFWIGGVIALGMFENALFYSEYQSISHHGQANGLLYFAEIVSCAKRALARILVVIVSIGFGIVKPRLGQTLHKVMIVGGAYFILASVEACMRVRDEKDFMTNKQMFALVPLTVLDVSICWWIFTSLVQTTRTLRIRKNIIKLTLYRHFTNTLIFTVLASLAYMVYMIKENRFNDCVSITTFWLNEALWPFLFALILAVIMILWRPSINNQRYAFTPLDMDMDNEDEDDMTLSDAFEGMKLRNTSDKSTVKNRKSADDDLKWVEENIPSVPSTLLPTIDSDEEILTTKFEQSKMN